MSLNHFIRFRQRKQPADYRTHWRGADFVPRKRGRFRIRLSPLPVVLVIFALFVGYFWSRQSDLPPPPSDTGQADAVSASFSMCGWGSRRNCVIDGDTFVFQGEKIRIADIDAPETAQPKCASEAALGKQATKRLRALLNEGPFTLEQWGSRDRDQYGRSLRMVSRDGHSLGDILVSEGLARPWTGRRLPWCD